MLLLIMCCDLEITDRRMTPAIKLVFAQAFVSGSTALLMPSMLLSMLLRGGSKRSAMWKTPYRYPVRCYTPIESVLTNIFTSFCPLPS